MICVKKTSCHKWTITDTTGTLDFTGSVDGLDGIHVADFEEPSAAIVLPNDGVYIATIITTTLDDQDQEVLTTSRFLIPDFCDLFACVKKLLLEIWCKEDICCDGCDSKKDEKKRHELNKMMAAYMSLVAIIYSKSFSYFGLTCLNDAKMKKVTEINQLYKTLKKIVENCGACKDTVAANSQPCKSC